MSELKLTAETLSTLNFQTPVAETATPEAATPQVPQVPQVSEATTEPVVQTTEQPKEQGITEPLKEEDLVKVLNERGISLSKLDDIKKYIEENQTYKQQVEVLSKKEIEFPNERAKALYEFATKHNGNELGAAQGYLNAVSLDLDKADPKTIQFEAFALKNPQYSREHAKATFEELYAEEYGDGNLEGKLALSHKHFAATQSSREAIQQAVKSYREAPVNETPKPTGPTPEQLEAVHKGIDGALKVFKGATVNLGEYKLKSGQTIPQGQLTVARNPVEDARFSEYLRDPNVFFGDVLQKVTTPNGVNWDAYSDTMYQIIYRDQINAASHAQGVEQGYLAALEFIKNSAPSKDPEGGKEPVQQMSWGEWGSKNLVKQK